MARIRTVERIVGGPLHGFWIARDPSTGEDVLKDFVWRSRSVARAVVWEARHLKKGK